MREREREGGREREGEREREKGEAESHQISQTLILQNCKTKHCSRACSGNSARNRNIVIQFTGQQ